VLLVLRAHLSKFYLKKERGRICYLANILEALDLMFLPVFSRLHLTTSGKFLYYVERFYRIMAV
jgi:hypothetical protein